MTANAFTNSYFSSSYHNTYCTIYLSYELNYQLGCNWNLGELWRPLQNPWGRFTFFLPLLFIYLVNDAALVDILSYNYYITINYHRSCCFYSCWSSSSVCCCCWWLVVQCRHLYHNRIVKWKWNWTFVQTSIMPLTACSLKLERFENNFRVA